MQEEIETEIIQPDDLDHKTVCPHPLRAGCEFRLYQYDKASQGAEQSMKRLVRQNRGVTSVEIRKPASVDFECFAKRYRHRLRHPIQKHLS